MRAHKSLSRVGGTEEDGDEDARAMVEDLLLGPAGRKLGDVNAIFTLDNTGRRTKICIQLEGFWQKWQSGGYLGVQATGCQ